MKLLLCALYEIDQNEVILNSKLKPNFAISNFNKKLIQGFDSNLHADLTVFSTRTVAAYPKYNRLINKQKKYRLDDIQGKEMFFVNLPLIKYVFEYIALYLNIKKWYEQNKGDNELYICSYGRRISHALAINKIKRKYKNITTCMIYGDLSGKLATQTNKENYYIRKFMDVLLNYSIKQSLKFDTSIFFTQYMSQALNNTKPSIVIEGLCDQRVLDYNKFSENINSKIIVVYTGIISKKYSLDILIDAFQYLDDNFELHLYGIGDLVNEIRNNVFPNIKYFGYLESDKITEIQRNASILINPRQNNEIYTRYSFPSKTLEYLSTGNPVICYKLDGIPDEYDNYLFYIDNNDAKSIAGQIVKVSKLTNSQKKEYKKSVFKFLQNKTSQKQCDKILTFLKEVNNQRDKIWGDKCER